MMAAKLTASQQNALDKFSDFIKHPTEKFLSITGAGGTGKSFLLNQMVSLLYYSLNSSQFFESGRWKKIYVTATTNKATAIADTLVSNYFIREHDKKTMQAGTTHSILGLVLKTDYSTGKSKLVLKNNAEVIDNSVIFIDEASMVSQELAKHILSRTHNCKIIFLGDSAQLLPVKETFSQVYHSKDIPTVELTDPVRFTYADLAVTANDLRENVFNSEPVQITSNGVNIKHINLEGAEQAVKQAFNYSGSDVILSYTNKRAIEWNQYILDSLNYPYYIPGCMYVCNNNAHTVYNHIVRTESLLTLGSFEPAIHPMAPFSDNPIFDQPFYYGEFIRESMNESDGCEGYFPVNPVEFLKVFRANESSLDAQERVGLRTVFDIRPQYAMTIHKSQGSTFKNVFIDAESFSRAPLSLATRLLYVAFSRASESVTFIGNLPKRLGEII